MKPMSLHTDENTGYTCWGHISRSDHGGLNRGNKNENHGWISSHGSSGVIDDPSCSLCSNEAKVFLSIILVLSYLTLESRKAGIIILLLKNEEPRLWEFKGLVQVYTSNTLVLGSGLNPDLPTLGQYWVMPPLDILNWFCFFLFLFQIFYCIFILNFYCLLVWFAHQSFPY